MANPRNLKDEVAKLLSDPKTVEEYKQQVARDKCSDLYLNSYDDKYKFGPADSVKTPGTELNTIYKGITEADIEKYAQERAKDNLELDESYRNRGIIK